MLRATIFFLALMVFTGAGATEGKLTYALIAAAHDEASDPEWDAIAEKLKGRRIDWTGSVLAIDRNWTNSRYSVMLDLDGVGLYDVSTQVDRAVALKLREGRRYRFTGKISRARATLGILVIRVDDARFHVPRQGN